jgi:hypothetical protein
MERVSSASDAMNVIGNNNIIYSLVSPLNLSASEALLKALLVPRLTAPHFRWVAAVAPIGKALACAWCNLVNGTKNGRQNHQDEFFILPFCAFRVPAQVADDPRVVGGLSRAPAGRIGGASRVAQVLVCRTGRRAVRGDDRCGLIGRCAVDAPGAFPHRPPAGRVSLRGVHHHAQRTGGHGEYTYTGLRDGDRLERSLSPGSKVGARPFG